MKQRKQVRIPANRQIITAQVAVASNGTTVTPSEHREAVEASQAQA